MNSLGFKSVVYHGDFCLGEVKILPAKTQNFQFLNNEIRINHISQTSDRCIPLAIFQTISSSSILCKLETNSSTTTTNDKSQLIRLHASCFHERKTAVVVFGKEEIHLVAMPSKEGRFPCFWCFSVPLGLYENCLEMLKIRCLAIVFDLDETLIVGNSLKSFEDKIGFLQSRMAYETEPDRISVISAELKRYTDDRSLLKQYVDADSVMDNGKLLRVQMEEVPAVPGRQDRLFRPVIRLQERNIVLTRINPEIRDTSVLVRLRPAWEDLRSYLIAGGRKRFEVYVCTMAENDYALEMWRLLDPETHLISLKQLVDRVVCVKSGCRKSLQNVFHNRTCHPKMAMVIDDRLNVWDDKDQPRVYGIPPFVPYLDPQMETANSLPALRVARNVASTVRSGFFKEFDENLLRTISSVCYEDDTANLPSPDVGNFLTSENAGFVPNGIVNAPVYEGIAGAEVDRSWNWVDHRNTTVDTSTPFGSNYRDPRPGASLQPVTISHNSFGDAASRTFASLQYSTLPGGSTKGHVSPSEIDPEARRRYFAMQQGHLMPKQGFKNPLSRPLPPVSALSGQSRGGWLVEENSGAGYPKNRAATMAQGVSAPHKPQDYQASSDIREIHNEGRKIFMRPSAISTQVLQEIGRKCETKVEFKLDGSTFKDLQFSFEVFFNGERIGYGKGRTKADAQNQAAEDALHNLAGKYATVVAPDPGVTNKDLRKDSLENENGFLWE